MHGFAGTSGDDILSVVRDAVHRYAHELGTDIADAIEKLLDLVVHEEDFLRLFPEMWHATLSQSVGRRTLRTAIEMLFQLAELQNGHLRDVGTAPNHSRHEPLARAAPP